MKKLLLSAAILMCLSGAAAAQNAGPNEGLDIVSDPICFKVVNEADYTILGNFATSEFTRPDGVVSRHRSNFRLGAAGTKEKDGTPADSAEFCSYGPFYEGRKLELVLRTLFPVFTCKTKIDQGPLVIKGRHKPEGGVETWAECFK